MIHLTGRRKILYFAFWREGRNIVNQRGAGQPAVESFTNSQKERKLSSGGKKNALASSKPLNGGKAQLAREVLDGKILANLIIKKDMKHLYRNSLSGQY